MRDITDLSSCWEADGIIRMTVKKPVSSLGVTLSKRSLKMCIFFSMPVNDRLPEIW